MERHRKHTLKKAWFVFRDARIHCVLEDSFKNKAFWEGLGRVKRHLMWTQTPAKIPRKVLVRVVFEDSLEPAALAVMSGRTCNNKPLSKLSWHEVLVVDCGEEVHVETKRLCQFQ